MGCPLPTIIPGQALGWKEVELLPSPPPPTSWLPLLPEPLSHWAAQGRSRAPAHALFSPSPPQELCQLPSYPTAAPALRRLPLGSGGVREFTLGFPPPHARPQFPKLIPTPLFSHGLSGPLKKESAPAPPHLGQPLKPTIPILRTVSSSFTQSLFLDFTLPHPNRTDAWQALREGVEGWALCSSLAVSPLFPPTLPQSL